MPSRRELTRDSIFRQIAFKFGSDLQNDSGLIQAVIQAVIQAASRANFEPNRFMTLFILILRDELQIRGADLARLRDAGAHVFTDLLVPNKQVLFHCGNTKKVVSLLSQTNLWATTKSAQMLKHHQKVEA